MNNELTVYGKTQLSEIEEVDFNWSEKMQETKDLVLENETLTSTIDEAKVKRLHVHIKIGINLIQLQKKYARSDTGTFTTKELPKLGIDQRFAYRCIGIATFAQEYGRSLPPLSKTDLLSIPLSIQTWRELASPSTPVSIVEKVKAGEIPATSSAIHKEIEAHKHRAKELEQKNEELHDRVHLLLEAEEIDGGRIKDLEKTIRLKDQWIDDLSQQLEENRGNLSQSAVTDTTDLEHTIKTLSTEKERVEREKARLEEELKASRRIAHQNLITDRSEQEIYDEEIRGNNRHRNGRLEKALREAILLFPSSLDAQQAYGADEWTRDEQLKQQIMRYAGMIDELKKMANVVDA